jgi:phosphoglycolate phosphatase
MSALDRKPEAVIFDWDDTLATNWDAIHSALNAALKHMGKPVWSKDKTQANVRLSLRDSFPQIFGAQWKEAGKVFYQHVRKNHLETLEPMNYSNEILEQLKSADIVLGIVSNKTGDLLRTECEYLSWNIYFKNIVGANDACQDKPSAEPLFLCLKGCGIEVSRHIWYVGDAVSDIECAYNAGVTGVLIKDSDNISDFINFPPHPHFRNLKEMSNYLFSM